MDRLVFRGLTLKFYLDCMLEEAGCLDMVLNMWDSEAFPEPLGGWELRGVKAYYDALATNIKDETETRLLLELVAETWIDIAMKPADDFGVDEIMGFKRGYSWI